MVNVLSAFSERLGPLASPGADLKDFYGRGADRLEKLGRVGIETSQAFAAGWTENMGPSENYRKILLLTATDIEDAVLTNQLKLSGFSFTDPRQLGGTISRVFAPKDGIQVFHVRSNAGSSGSGGSTLTAVDALDGLQPDFVVSVGIAFGIDKDKQKMHDLLISTRMWNYEPGRLTGDDGLTPRGEELPASSVLLAASRHVQEEADRTQFGIVASGEKLVDKGEFVENLKRLKPDIIGGEMEGSGISAACQRKKFDWIMIKSICDWGDNKTKEFQKEAATRASSFSTRLINYLATVR